MAYLKHRLTAWNTGGEGVHSPYLFYMVRMLMYDANQYYCWSSIEQHRAALLRSSQIVHVTDYGTGSDRDAYRKVATIARCALEKPKIAQLLFRLSGYAAESVRQDGYQPCLLELGTSLGITTAYLASVDSHLPVVTMDGAAEVVEVARAHFDQLGLHNIRCEVGNIDDLLPRWVEYTLYNNTRARLALAFVDANHTCKATLQYYEQLIPLLSDKSMVVVDDIHHSPEMESAWHTLIKRQEVTSSIDLYDIGILLFDSNYLKKHYKMRF